MIPLNSFWLVWLAWVARASLLCASLRSVQIEATKREAEKNMKLERENWLSAEKVRLEKLASAKSSELKKDAVKALEPELHRLLSGNKLDLQQRVESYEEQFEAFQCEREKEAGVKLQEEKRRMEKEAEGESEKIRKVSERSASEANFDEDYLR